MRAKTGKDFFSANKDNNDELNQNNQQNIYNSPNMTSNVNPLPAYDVGKQAFPAYSFPKDERY